MLKKYLIFRDPGVPGEYTGGACTQTNGDQNFSKPPVAAKPPPLTGEAQQSQIDAWKQSHPLGIFHIKKAGRIAYFKQASFQEIDAYYELPKKQKMSMTDEWKLLAGMLWIGGNRELIESALYLPNVAKRLQESIAGEESEMVNL